jgi:ankyrin repeat protein
MVRDGREAQAIEILKRRLASLSLIKKSDLRCLVNELFLRSLDKGFDDLVLLLTDCGFPENFDSAIYGHTKTRRFPSYLLLSVCLGRLRIVEKICEIQPRVHLNKGWFNGIRPLMLAQMTPKLTWKSFQMTELLLKTGAEPNRSITYNTFLEGLRFRRCRLSKTDEGEGSRGLREIYKKTRLYAIDFACVRGKFESVQLLLRFEKRPWRDWLGRSEFCLLRLLNFEVAAEILRRIPELIKQRDPRGNTPLHWAAKMGRTDLIALYLKYSETVDVLNRMHWTPLHEAAASAHRSTVQYLISRGADCSIRNLEGQTALQVARENGISSEELFDFFHSADTMQKTLKLLGQLVIPGALEGQQVAPLKGTSRLLIQKLMKYPKKFFKKSFKTV